MRERERERERKRHRQTKKKLTLRSNSKAMRLRLCLLWHRGAASKTRGAPSLTHTKGPSVESASLAIPPSETRWTSSGPRTRTTVLPKRCRVGRNPRPSSFSPRWVRTPLNRIPVAQRLAHRTARGLTRPSPHPPGGATIARQSRARLVIVPRQPDSRVCSRRN